MPNENRIRILKYLEHTIQVNIRFSEVDSLGIVWHGNYLKFFEDGREHLGLKYGMSYKTMYDNRLILPIVDTQLSFKSVLRFGHTARVVTRLIESRAAKVIHHYKVYNETTNKLAATGTTTQVFVNEQMELQLYMPEAFEKWKQTVKWEVK